MSRNSDRIRKAFAAKGYEVTYGPEWRPVWGPLEFEGYLGGWTVAGRNQNGEHRFLGGYNTTEILANIAALPDADH